MGVGKIRTVSRQLIDELGLGGGGSAAIVSGTAITSGCPPHCPAPASTTTAELGERVLYDPSNSELLDGSPAMTFAAPASPILGSRWAIKNRSASQEPVIIDGNGSDIEDPLASYAVAASFTLSGDGISVEWEFDGAQWLVI